ncbi:TlpA family protein disulfide reductase [Flavihumibacter rivuli]|uniref:peroxiredoxin family protein n=1 Tax=Flavihumibacter rivuli TaxID=2838156 RepID=UPI001EFAC9B0|nr:TlpA disulfide reductase family protein [Flavihumibacter rivuli]ULQ55111.1 TlpA family protein disulfide reductase [Flavihumibacter rivuli]
MKLIRLTGLLLLISVIAVQCKSKEAGGAFSVAVNYSNADQLVPMPYRKILLEEIPYGGDGTPVVLDSVGLKDAKGSLTLKGKAKEEGIYQLVVENGPVLLLVNDADEITVDLDMSKRENYYTVKGSEGSEEIRNFIQQYSERGAKINKAFAELDSLKTIGGNDSLLLVYTNRKNDQVASINTYMKEVLNKTSHPAVSLFVLGMSSRSMQKDDFETVLNTTVKKFPEHLTLKSLKQTYDMQQAQVAEMEKQRASKSLVGKPAPELSLPDANGKNIAISSFRGKYVLVDFWASWCGPCRQENPNVVRAFEKYRDKNFTILGVSLDKEKDAWLKAIEKDRLTWTHISDLKFWDSESVKVYGFEGIPYNVLIDPNGTVIAENLRGFDLDKKLSEVLK